MHVAVRSNQAVPFGGAVVSGILLALPWLGLPGILMSVAFCPLIITLIRSSASPSDLARKWHYPLITFLTWNLLSTWWIGAVSLTGGWMIILLNSLLMTLVTGLILNVQQKLSRPFALIFLICCWLSFEFLHHRWELSWPWLTLGNSLAGSPLLIQWYEYTGVLGGSLWILLVNLAVCSLLLTKTRKIIHSVVLLLLVLFPVLISVLLQKQAETSSGSFQAAVLQPNINPYTEKFSRLSPDQQLKILLELADSLNSPTVEYFVGPETALPSIDESGLSEQLPIQKIAGFLSGYSPQASFILGAEGYQRNCESLQSDSLTNFYNSVYLINDSDQVAVYHKTRLVSGVEKMPFARQCPFLERYILPLGGHAGSLTAPEKFCPIRFENSTIATPVCYESAYGEFTGQFVRHGAQTIFLLTNDGWWDHTPGYRQHLMLARIRAIENRRMVVRSANTGISALIDEKGRFVKKTIWGQRTGFVAQVSCFDRMTLYARFGDYLGRFSVIISLLVLVWYGFNYRGKINSYAKKLRQG